MKTLYEITEILRKLGTFTIARMFDETSNDDGEPVYQFLIYGDVCANKDFDKLATQQVYRIADKEGIDNERLWFYFSPVDWYDYRDLKSVIDIEDPTEWYLETDNQKLHELADDLMSEMVCYREEIEANLGRTLTPEPEDRKKIEEYEGKVTYRQKTYRYRMTVSDRPEPTGLNGGHILSLTIWLNNNTMAEYNEKWVVRPYFNDYEPLFDLICEDARQI